MQQVLLTTSWLKSTESEPRTFGGRGIIAFFTECYFVLLPADVEFKHPAWKSLGILVNLLGISAGLLLTGHSVALGANTTQSEG